MENRYKKLTPDDIRALKTIAGAKNVFTRKEQLEDYSSDEGPRARPSYPQVVVKPTDTSSVSNLLKYANRNRVPVTPRGAGTGLSGGCIPVHGGIVLSLEKMDRILEIDSSNFVATVEPGVSLKDLCAAVEKQGLYYPLYPGEMSATVGGNAATNAGGMNAVKYGVTRHQVLGLEAVLPAGEIIRTGGKFVKCSTGYDLTQLLIGSEGTLAVITGILLKLTTPPAKRDMLFVPFMSLQEAIDAVPEILLLKLVPRGLEFMERNIIEIVEKYLDREIPYHQYEAFLMIIMEAESDTEMYDYFSKVEEICKKHGAVETMVPGSQRARRKLLHARENFYNALKKYAPMEIIDAVVPRSEIARFVKKVKEMSERHHIPVVAYGHAGDGNVHLHPLCINMSASEWEKRLKVLMTEIYQAGASVGGTVSGEHGIGLDKKEYLKVAMDPALLNAMKTVKKAFDPNHILNPGKIFDM